MRSRRIGCALVAAIALALGLLGPAGAVQDVTSKDGGTLVVGMASGNVDTLDPTISRSGSSGEIYRTIRQRLYGYDTSGDVRLAPLLAASMPVLSEDKLS